MKNAGNAPRACHSKTRTITIMTSASSSWLWRRTVATSSDIGCIVPAAVAAEGRSRYDGLPMATRTPDAVPRQRWQLLFSRTGPALRMRQAQLVSELERVFTEASLPLSYTGAQKPKPRIKLAANLPVGIELRGEVVEAYFDELVPLERIQAAAELFPEGIELRDAKEVWYGFPSAASQVRGAEYEVEVAGDDGLTTDALRGAVVRLLNAKKLEGMRRRGESERRSDVGTRDLRPLIEDVEVVDVDEKAHTATIRTVLQLDASGAGRPEDIVNALDLPLRVVRAVRTRLVFVDTPPIAR
jgi:radical SAM-linked protein